MEKLPAWNVNLSLKNKQKENLNDVGTEKVPFIDLAELLKKKRKKSQRTHFALFCFKLCKWQPRLLFTSEHISGVLIVQHCFDWAYGSFQKDVNTQPQLLQGQLDPHNLNPLLFLIIIPTK